MSEFGPSYEDILGVLLVIMAFVSIVIGFTLHGIMHLARHLPFAGVPFAGGSFAGGTFAGGSADLTHDAEGAAVAAARASVFRKASSAALALTFGPLWFLNYSVVYWAMNKCSSDPYGNSTIFISLGTDLLELCLAALSIGVLSSLPRKRGLQRAAKP